MHILLQCTPHLFYPDEISPGRGSLLAAGDAEAEAEGVAADGHLEAVGGDGQGQDLGGVMFSFSCYKPEMGGKKMADAPKKDFSNPSFQILILRACFLWMSERRPKRSLVLPFA